jgi:hypothetical protein
MLGAAKDLRAFTYPYCTKLTIGLQSVDNLCYYTIITTYTLLFFLSNILFKSLFSLVAVHSKDRNRL